MISYTLYPSGYPSGIPFDNPVIRFYAIFIIVGAILALVLSNYRAYKAGYDPKFFNMVFLVAFPSGIIGARVWYVIASWADEFANGPFYRVFEIWNGGLAIQGGVIFGVIAGVLFVKFARKGTPVLQATDMAVPTILIAQAIGRWGNFFNSEVFGHAVSLDAWGFLPSFITNNMTGSMSGGVVIPTGQVAAPLFLVEGVINVTFYFVITEGLKAIEGKHYKYGDQSFFYFIAYGVTRLILEPVRNSAFIMGSQDGDFSTYNSLIMAIVFIIVGVLLITLNHVLRYLSQKGKLDRVPILNKFIASGEAIVEDKTTESFSDEELKKLTELENKNKDNNT